MDMKITETQYKKNIQDAVEWGFKAKEKGWNLEKTMKELWKLM